MKLKGNQPLHVKFVPQSITDAIGSWNGGLAGALLLISVFFSGKLLGITMLLAAAVALFGQRLNLPLIAGQTWVAAIAGVAVWVVGIVFFRRVAGR